MKRISEFKISAGRLFFLSALSFFLVFFVALSPVMSEEAAEESSSEKPAPRDLPLKNIFNSSDAKVEAVADTLEYQKDTGKLIARGNAVITYQGTRILADYAEVETDAKKAYAKGHVMIFKGDEPQIQGEEIYYDFGNHTGTFPNARVMSPPWYARGADVQQTREGVYKVQKGAVTTCNFEKPHYEVRCKKATLYVDEKILMRNVTIYVLGKPVFWLPFMDVPLNWPNIPIQATAGYSKQYGPYVGLMKGITINKYLWGRAQVDWRQKRGFGAGWDQYYNFGKYAHGSVKLYLTQDKKAPTPGYVNADGELDPYAERRDKKRGRITWRHRTDVNDYTHVLLRYSRLADEYFLQDFFEEEYRAEMQPRSFVTATHNSQRYGAMIHLEKKMNGFEALVERMPEVRLDWKNQPFFTDKIFNESRIQFDNLAKTYTRSSTKQEAIRTDAYTNWYMPLRWNDVNIMPFGGYRGTFYSQQANSNSATFRNIGEYGIDLRTHFYRTFDVSFDKIGIEVNQLRHVAVPIVRVEGAVSSVDMDRLTRFDTIDAIDSSSRVVMGFENRLQTKRVVAGKTQRVDIVSLNTYLFYEMQPIDPTIGNNQFTLFRNELTLRPYEWLQYQAKVTYSFATTYFKSITQDLLIRKGPWKFLFGYRFTHRQYDWYTEQTIPTSQQFVFDTRYVLNHLWEVGGFIRWDTKQQKVNEWEISAARDLHDFILEFGYNVRDSLIDSNNIGAFVNFRMKAFPSYVLRSGQRASFSEPRIGETVAGANEGAGMFGTPTMTGAQRLISEQ